MFWVIFWILVGTSIWFGNYFTNKALFPETWDHESARERELRDQPEELAYFESLSKEPFEIDSTFGYGLKGYTISVASSRKIMIFAHGITYNLYGAVKYLKMFHEWGFNILVYDHANHGNSGGDITTFGFYEKKDLKSIVDYALVKWGTDSQVGVHGESMGAATALEHAAIDSRVSFVISDCSFDTAYNEFKYRLRVEKHLPAFPTLNVASYFSYLKSGVFFNRMSPIEALKNIDIPILFIHGLADVYTPPEQTKRLYQVYQGPKRLYLVAGAKHAKSYYVDPAAYRREVEIFLKAYL